jgi:hypothetical protein
MDRRGSAEILAFIIILPLLLFPLFNGVYAYMDMNRYDIMKQVAREALLRMEINGGLKETDRERILDYLAARGFDISRIEMDYTPHPVGFGEEVAFRISYSQSRVRYTLGFEGLRRIEEDRTMTYGPVKTTSKRYER